MVQTNQKAPSVSSQDKDLKKNADGSVDVYFGPKAPEGYENNWVQTLPGKGWFMILRLYGPLEPWFDKTWRPGEIELVKTADHRRAGGPGFGPDQRENVACDARIEARDRLIGQQEHRPKDEGARDADALLLSAG